MKITIPPKPKRPEMKDYFAYKGGRIIYTYGSSGNYIEALEDYIDHLESKLKSNE